LKANGEWIRIPSRALQWTIIPAVEFLLHSGVVENDIQTAECLDRFVHLERAFDTHDEA
jgi:hypothetical protein